MKKTLSLTLRLLISCALIAPLASCGGSTTTNNPTTSPSPVASAPSPAASPEGPQLNIERSILARKGTDGKLTPVDNQTFKPGEDVHIVLLNVGKFQKGADGKNWLDMDMVVTNSGGKTVLSKEKLLGEGGKVALPNDVADSPYGTVNTSPTTTAGVYKINLTIYDRVGGAKATETKEFTLQK